MSGEPRTAECAQPEALEYPHLVVHRGIFLSLVLAFGMTNFQVGQRSCTAAFSLTIGLAITTMVKMLKAGSSFSVLLM